MSHYRQRVQQCEALGEFAMAEHIRGSDSDWLNKLVAGRIIVSGRSSSQDVKQLALEAQATDPTARPSVPRDASARVTLPKSPFVAKRADESGEHQRPPQSHVQPQLDSKLVPTPRRRENVSADTSPTLPKAKSSPKAEPKAAPKKGASKDKPKGKP